MPEFQEKSALKLNILSEDTKVDIRSKVWDFLELSGLASYPKIPRRRISNFKGSEEAGEKITELEAFKKAQILRIDPDRPLQEIRYKTLEAGKTLLVPTPRLKNHVFSKILPPPECGEKLLRSCAARQGVKEYSEPVDIDEKIKVDAVIVGCVAVSSKGWRVGKGGGLSDLEYAMMASLGVVDQNVPVITMVHDSQVVDLPDSLFGPHDLPVDFIVTPTRIIECTGRLAKPSTIFWNLLTEDKLNHIPVLKRIRYRHWKEGKDVKLNGETESPSELVDIVLDEEETLEDRRRGYRRNRRPIRRREADDEETTGDEEKKDRGDNKHNFVDRRKVSKGRYRSYRNRRFQKKFPENSLGSDGQTDEDNTNRRRTRNSSSEKHGDSSNEERRSQQYRGRKPIYESIEGSVYVGSLPRTLRVSEFKTEVRERQVNPLRVLWRGSSGFAFLNFKSQRDAEEALVALEGLQISDKAIKLEMAKSPTGRRGRNRVSNNSTGDKDK